MLPREWGVGAQGRKPKCPAGAAQSLGASSLESTHRDFRTRWQLTAVTACEAAGTEPRGNSSPGGQAEVILGSVGTAGSHLALHRARGSHRDGEWALCLLLCCSNRGCRGNLSPQSIAQRPGPGSPQPCPPHVDPSLKPSQVSLIPQSTTWIMDFSDHKGPPPAPSCSPIAVLGSSQAMSMSHARAGRRSRASHWADRERSHFEASPGSGPLRLAHYDLFSRDTFRQL